MICRHSSLPIDPPAPVTQTDIFLLILAFNSFPEGSTLAFLKYLFDL